MKTNVVLLVTIGLFLIGCSSAPSDPKVTYQENVSNTYYPNFGSRYYKLYDANRLCTKNGNTCFVVTKTNQIINTADRCDRCNHCWYDHYKK